MKGYRGKYILAILTTVIIQIMRLINPIFSQKIVDDFIYGENAAENLESNRRFLILLCAGMIIFTVARSVIQFISNTLFEVCSQGMLARIRNQLFARVQRQKQLIAFARTLISDPKILMLDEATSSIDAKTEKLLQEGLNRLLKGRTSFIIAHRLSTIRNCDKIMYISDGGITESGTHAELMAKKGAYYKLCMTGEDSVSSDDDIFLKKQKAV